MDEQLVSALSCVKSSNYRMQIVVNLHGGVMTPAELQEKLDIRINHVSSYLRELKEKGIVVCLNEDAKKGRLYELSELGNELYSYLK